MDRISLPGGDAKQPLPVGLKAIAIAREALKKVASDGQARRNQIKKRSLQDVNEHFESDFNTV